MSGPEIVRLCETVGVARHSGGKTTATIRCAFCGTDTEARVWSLAGSGKRCECGAVLSIRGIGNAYARKGLGKA